jgi:hypothetical protein
MVKYKKMAVCGSYAIISEDKYDFLLFLGNGTYINGKGFSIESAEKTNAILEYRDGEYFLSCESPILIQTPQGDEISFSETEYKKSEKFLKDKEFFDNEFNEIIRNCTGARFFRLRKGQLTANAS